MCGIAGLWDGTGALGAQRRESAAAAMRDSLRHRGPDGAGLWSDQESGLTLAHRRLAILDLSAEGAQPMASGTGRYVISYNGEIYNHEELRSELSERSGARFRGRSDTEVLLALIEEAGFEKALGALNGMFAIALWDRREKRLLLARDRMGEKPLYYGRAGSCFAFASELRAFRSVPGFEARLDPEAMGAFMKYACVPAPLSAYRGISKLPPGCWLSVSGGAPAEPRGYWSVAESARARPWEGGAEEASEEVRRLLSDSVRLRMRSDVPFGAFLSGGVDSTSVVAAMRRESAAPVKTFTIGFHEAGFDEAAVAREVAARLGTEHHELYVTPAEAMSAIPELPAIYDEPFADSSQIPTYLVSRLARKSVTVVLSGDGGDELFGGYTRHLWADSVWRRIALVPRPLRRFGAGLLRSVRGERWDAAAPFFGRAFSGYAKQGTFGDKMHKAAEALEMEGVEALYERLVSAWPAADRVVPGASEGVSWTSGPAPRALGPAESMMFRDQLGYLPDDILVKVDRAAMAVSLEGRMPFLDHRLVELAWRLPLEWKISRGVGKSILRGLLERDLPREIMDRPKMGFGVPLDEWLRGPLRDWAEGLLEPRALENAGVLDPGLVRARWAEHLDGRRNRSAQLWCALSLSAWLRDGQGVRA